MVELIFIGRNSGGVVNSLEVKDVGSYGTNNVSIGITVQHNTTILYQDSIDTYSISKGGSILLSSPYNDSGILTGIYRVLFRVKNNDTGVVQEYESSQELTYIPYQQSISITANGLLSTISATDSNPYTGSIVSSYELKHISPNGAVTTTANHSLSIPATFYAGTHTFTATVDTVWNETNIVLYDRLTLYNTEIVYNLDKTTLWTQVDSLNTEYQSKLGTNITEANRLRDKVLRCNTWQDDYDRAIADGETLPAYTALLNINSELNTTSTTVEEIPVFTITVPEGHTHTNKLQVLDLLANVGGDLYFNGVKVDKDTVAGLTIDTSGVAFIPYVDEDGILSLNIVSIDLTTDLTLTGTLTLNGYNKFLKATAGVVSEADITESDLVLSDNTTNNSSLTKHGFLKKLDGNAYKFLNGQGEFAFVPSAASDILASVLTIVEDDTFDPATSPYSINEGDRYIVLTTSLHTSFGTINKDMNGDAITLGVNDVVECYLGEFRVAFDSSAALQSATAQVQLYNGQENYDWTYNVPTSEWINRGAPVLHNDRSDLNTGTGRFIHLLPAEQTTITSIVSNANDDGKFLRDDFTWADIDLTEIFTEATITGGAVTLDMSVSKNYYISTSGNFTLNITNANNGNQGILVIKSSASFVITLGTVENSTSNNYDRYVSNNNWTFSSGLYLMEWSSLDLGTGKRLFIFEQSSLYQKATLSVSPSSLNFEFGAENFLCDVSITPSTAIPVVTDNQLWITATYNSSYNTVDVAVTENTSGLPRTGLVTLTHPSDSSIIATISVAQTS